MHYYRLSEFPSCCGVGLLAEIGGASEESWKATLMAAVKQARKQGRGYVLYTHNDSTYGKQCIQWATDCGFKTVKDFFYNPNSGLKVMILGRSTVIRKPRKKKASQEVLTQESA